MSRGARIVVNADAKGPYEWGYVATAEKPGTLMQIDASVALKAGKHTWVPFNRAADGDLPAGPYGVIVEDLYQGRDATTAIEAGTITKLYIPQPGDELNLLFFNQSGTADDVALGDLLIVDDGTGKVFKTTGTPEHQPAIALEALVDPTADQLLWVRWSGY
jgi:hypothetical protein